MRSSGRFQIASVTKTFVTAVVLSLVDEGSLSLDQTVEPWFPEIVECRPDHDQHAPVPPQWTGRLRPRSPRRLSGRDPPTWRIATHHVEAIALSTSLAARFAPGDGYSYSNTNFQILGEIAADITRTPIGELIDQRLTRPLHLDSTSLADESAVEPDEHHGWFTLDAAIGDLEDATFDPTIARDLDILDFPRNAVVTQIGAAGAMRSSIDDLLTWGTALYGGDLNAKRSSCSSRRPPSPARSTTTIRRSDMGSARCSSARATRTGPALSATTGRSSADARCSSPIPTPVLSS